MAENLARLILYDSDEFFAEKNFGQVRLLEVEFTEEEVAEDVLKKKARRAWGIEPNKVELLCILPKNKSEFVQYFACKDWNGEFENLETEEIVSLSFDEALELSEKTDALAVEVLEKAILGKSLQKQAPAKAQAISQEIPAPRPKNPEVKLEAESTNDFEIMPAVPKGMGRKQQEATREGIDYEFLSKGRMEKPRQKSKKKGV
ncbi:MAG: hypothetical protein J4478_03390 [Candidatus Diapherotrites archaeon]|uniref:Uncharacterized protein n=1 Tax=Candidatus Iainarchaeum sp. TaxID=3101447 RepID=A0A8T4KVS0_9ARCH|nr:hypothetical protein [Candidatus Diapherotrites archaeon]